MNSKSQDDTPFISSDGLSLYFFSFRQGGDQGGGDIWLCTRETTESKWGSPENLGPPINTSSEEFHPSLSADGLEFYFARWDEASGDSAIWVSTRTAADGPWAEPVKLDLTPDSTDEWDPSLTADGLQLYFGIGVPGDESGTKLYVAMRQSKDSPWGAAVSLGPVVNNWTFQVDPRIASDGRLLLFADYLNGPNRPGGFGEEDMWLSTRATSDSAWSEPVNLGSSVNSVLEDVAGMISADGSTLYFTSDRCGGSGRLDLWQAPVLPVVDFDDDGVIGMSDLLAMIGWWGTDEPLRDIGPMPWGDGVVDEADLEVLMNYWGQEITVGKPELVAHWSFDEAEGTIARDSAGTFDANLVGDPTWKPNGGIAAGALELDGIDDYVDTPFLLDPANSFSVFAWIQGGGLNQAILVPSQRVVLLQADHVAGNLMTAFMFDADDFLISQTPIIDGQWHHVGLIWDDSAMTKTLYVDGIEVARGAVTKCPWGGSARLLIGTGESPFINLWSGPIDDVRVYKGALSAEDVAALAQ